MDKQQLNELKKRNLENSNSEQDHLHKRKKKKKERRDEVHQLDTPPSLLQAEEQRHVGASAGESSAHTNTQLNYGNLNGSQGKDHLENGKKRKKKKNVNQSLGEVFNDDTEISKAEKKKEKKSFEDAVEESPHKVISKEPEEDKISRKEEQIEVKRKKKKKKMKVKEEGVEESRHTHREIVTLINGVGSDGLDSGNVDGEPAEANKEKDKRTKRKKVTFSDKVIAADQEQARDVLNEADQSGINESPKDDVEEIWGVRFSAEEDETLKDAVWTYIKSKGWDEHAGLEKVFNSKKCKEAYNCWADIKMSLPHRPRQAVRFRARLLLETGGHLGKWSKEEEDLLKRLQSERGHKWREFSSILNRQRSCIKEKWRSLKRSDTLKEKGGWTQDELQRLSKMVHESLRMNRLLATKKEKLDRHLLRDDIGWEKIADTLGTHNHGPCCSKWYYNLQSSLVADGHWANQDDFLLLESLLESGASTEEEVEWDNLLEHRSGQVCLTRWKQMVKHLGENRTRQFLDKLDILAHRYAPELLETCVENNMSIESPSVDPHAR